MLVIFLDIDGVLNCSETMRKSRKARGKGVGRYSSMIDTGMVHRLNRIISATGAVCVLSSSWRILLKPEQMESVLQEHGFIGKIIDRTGSCGHRGNEIRDWLLAHPEVEKYIVLDDEDSDMDGQYDHLIKTSWDTGIEDEHVTLAINRLKKR